MEIRKFNSAELQRFIYSEEYKNLEVIPITKHRALSHINNPRLDKEDYILYLAFISGELVGYRVVMADTIYLKNILHKIGWYSCVWVDPTKRGKGIAKKLVTESLKDWKNKIVLVDPVPASKALYLQTGQFTDKVKLEGIRGYVRFNLSEILTNKIPKLNSLKFFLKGIDQCLNIPNSIRLGLWKLRKNYKKIHFEYVTTVDIETETFIQKHSQQDLSKRNSKELNWILQYPWVLMTPERDINMQKYYFSSQSKEFITSAIKLYNNNKLSAFMILSLRDGNLKIPFISLTENTNLESLVKIIYLHLLKYNSNTFTIFNKQLGDYITHNKNPFIFTKKIQRQYLFSKLFEENINLETINLQDGEGDTAFT